MKIKISKLMYFFYIVIAVLSYHVFYLFEYNETLLYGYRFRIWVALLGVVFYLFIITKQIRAISKYGKYIHYYLLVTLISIGITTLYAQLKYPSQSIMDTLGLSSRFLWVFWVVPILYLFEKHCGYDRFVHILNVVSFVWILVALMQVIAHRATGSIIFDFDAYLNASAFRRGEFVRIGLESLGNFFLLFNTLLLVEKVNRKHRKYYSIYCVIGWFYLVFVQQTRAFTLVAIICLGVILLCSSKLSIKQFVLTLGILCGVGYLFASGIVDTFLQTFSITGENANSTISRMAGMEYYWNSFIQNPLFAIGFAHSGYYASLIHGTNSRFYLDDIGIVGTLSQLGLFLIPIYIVPIIRMIYLYIKGKKNYSSHEKKMMLVIISFIVCTSATLMITDSQRVLLWPVLIALVEHINIKCQQ